MSKCFTNYVTCINACDIVQTLINCSHHWVFILLVFTAIYRYLPNKWMWHWTRGRCALCALIYKFAPHFTWKWFRSSLLLFALFVCFASFGIVAIKLNAQIDMKNEHMHQKKFKAGCVRCSMQFILNKKSFIHRERDCVWERERESSNQASANGNFSVQVQRKE